MTSTQKKMLRSATLRLKWKTGLMIQGNWHSSRRMTQRPMGMLYWIVPRLPSFSAGLTDLEGMRFFIALRWKLRRKLSFVTLPMTSCQFYNLSWSFPKTILIFSPFRYCACPQEEIFTISIGWSTYSHSLDPGSGPGGTTGSTGNSSGTSCFFTKSKREMSSYLNDSIAKSVTTIIFTFSFR